MLILFRYGFFFFERNVWYYDLIKPSHCCVLLLVQVDQMVAYAVGEMTRQAAEPGPEVDATRPGCSVDAPGAGSGDGGGGGEGDIGGNRLQLTAPQQQQSSKPTSCYEVVTAWVHPR